MKKLLLSLFAVLLSSCAWAYSAYIGGIYYDLNSETKKAEVTFKDENYNSYSGDVVIPSSVTYSGVTYSVTSIGSCAFLECTSLTSIEIPNSVTSIGSNAFAYCTNLTSIDIPNSVTSIGGYAFYNTAWYNNQSDGLIYAGKVAYNYKGTMPQNTSIIIKDGTTGISGYAFESCTGLTSIEFPNSVTSIGEGAFHGCTGLTSIVIPNSVTWIGSYAFYGCIGLTSVKIGDSVRSIGSSAFSGCSGLTSVTIPNSIASIGNHCFYNCSSLTSIDIPNSVASIGKSAFSYCSSLTSIDIPNSVTSIGQSAFSYCSKLTSIDIPNSVTSIGTEAFGGCSGLNSIKVHWNRPLAVESSVFEKIDKTACTLYVPKGTAMMFMSATGWNEFANIIEYEDGDNAHYITIRMGDGGELQQSVELGKIYIYKVKADEGWTVNTLTFNGEDMTGQLLDGQFSTPVITGNAELNVVFKQEASNIKSMKQTEATKVKVYAYNGTVRVAGAEDDAEIEVYNAGGILIANGEGNCSISLDSGIYIVKVGNETFKVGL